MVFIGVSLTRTEKNQELVKKFNDNLKNKDVANVMFNDASFIDFASYNIVIIYLKPLFPRAILYYITAFLLLIFFIFNAYLILYLLGVFWGLFFATKYFVYLLFTRGMRKLGCKDPINLI